MATDPISNIHVVEDEIGYSTNLDAALTRLGRLEPSPDAPYLTIYLDWRPQGSSPGTRSALTVLDQGLPDIQESYEAHTPARESLDEDIPRIREYLDGVDSSIHGVIIVACNARDVFETFELAIPLETQIHVRPAPSLMQMAKVADEYPRYAVLLADQHDARLSIINRASHRQIRKIEGSDYPRKTRGEGGWSHRRYQARAEERQEQFARGVAEETRGALEDEDIEMLVVAGNEPMHSLIKDEFHESVTDRIIGEAHIDIRATDDDIIEETLPIAQRHARRNAFENAKAVQAEIDKEEQGVAGVEDTLRALEMGQVMTLIVSTGFHCPGWADYTMNVYGAGDPPHEHPEGGNPQNIYRVDLEEEMIRLALATDADLEVVPDDSAAGIKAHGGIGALLRF